MKNYVQMLDVYKRQVVDVARGAVKGEDVAFLEHLARKSEPVSYTHLCKE